MVCEANTVGEVIGSEELTFKRCGGYINNTRRWQLGALRLSPIIDLESLVSKKPNTLPIIISFPLPAMSANQGRGDEQSQRPGGPASETKPTTTVKCNERLCQYEAKDLQDFNEHLHNTHKEQPPVP
jgi:hypothetical protein